MNTPTTAASIKATADNDAASAFASGSDLAKQLCPLIAEQPLFKGLSVHQLQVLADSAMKVEFKPDESIFQEGAPANRFYGTRLQQQCEEDHDLGYELMKRIAEVLIQNLHATQQRLMECTDVRKLST